MSNQRSITEGHVMTTTRQVFSRRRLLQVGGATALVGVLELPGRSTGTAQAANPPRMAAAALKADVYTHLAGTDGWISLPPLGTFYHPDNLAPAPQNTYVFGFADATSFIVPGTGSAAGTPGLAALKNHAQIDAPLLGYDENTKVQISLTNLGLAQRPDLVDSHTIHWHGFKNAIPLFDGVPEMSVADPIGRTFAFFYDLTPDTAGTYMYHCHFEDVEHVQMGMRGMVYVRPAQNHNAAYPSGSKFVYNDGDGSTRYDREFSVMLTDMWLESHWNDAHIQQSDWSDFTPDAYLLNGRSAPDTLLPSMGDPALSVADAARLRYQPYGSLIRCNAGDRVLLRAANLGYTQPAMTLDQIPLTVVGRDAAWLRGHYVQTHTLHLGPGESADALFTAPPVTKLTSFRFENRSFATTSSRDGRGPSGQSTRVDVHPAGTLPAQNGINR